MDIKDIDLHHDGKQWVLTLSTPTTGRNGQETVRKRRTYHPNPKAAARKVVETLLEGVRLDLRAMRDLEITLDRQTEKLVEAFKNGF